METANCNVIIGKFGSTVPRTHVTPAEVQYLIHEHGTTVGRLPVVDLQVTGSVNRDVSLEKMRLKEFYDQTPDSAKNKVEKLFPGLHPALPKTFEEVIDSEGNRPFGKGGVPTEAAMKDGMVEIGGQLYSPHEVAQLVAAGKAALQVGKPIPGTDLPSITSGSEKDQDLAEEDAVEITTKR
jgi:hypothetical protein